MNKNELIEVIAQSADISKNAAGRALDAFVDSVTKSLQEGEDVVLVGFGSFTTSQRAARTGRNPQTGDTMQIPAATVARFKAGKKLKDAVNKEKV
ncbi:HU family DNA-binding protein [Coxiella burnetii]|uniref:DNA-binding protein HU n=2 Tax=Coxiella burnetii TaxID=777 RepID=Q83BN9_COXBU|nr:HU family DNA-binding protein [Coxiella burnetii]NP_820447.1 DNA-binding protein HU [Coxiella burnetii RSA 493]AAO90961.1 DNA-binding protein HU [Coxiella burnetii RSA 493]ABS76503.1 DNA-binding protein HU [Coxiella burnetii Dugway 5J108-111]ABX78389.1 DNA-binding protein HU [Coxiella burnetii RSA 331]ACJ17963.1 DNA-binding protein HU [Coxiella burnetii CbuG_Q212]ACJ20830.1 DNA-binding protein HU [Coxiella burnetii CbuK_Q154]